METREQIIENLRLKYQRVVSDGSHSPFIPAWQLDTLLKEYDKAISQNFGTPVGE